MLANQDNSCETHDVESLARENRRLKNELAMLKAADRFVRERERILQIILNSATDVIVTIDHSSRIIHANTATYKVFGYTATELTGQSVTILMPEVARERHLSEISRFLRTGQQQQSWQGLRFNGLHRDGHEFPIEMTFGAVQRPDGTFRFTGIIRDVTALVEAEDCKRRQLGELAHRQRLLSVGEMASGLAHELNQPLLAICLQADVAADQLGTAINQGISLPGEPTNVAIDQSVAQNLQSSLSEIATQAERASRVIRSVRSLVRRDEVSKTSVALAKIVSDVLPICEHCCDQGRAQLVVDVSDQLPNVIAEETLIGQVVANLVQNAVTAMDEVVQSSRKVRLTARKISDSLIEVSVSDAGKGLGTDAIDQIFESFYTTASDGLGLGLVICRSIIEGHGDASERRMVPMAERSLHSLYLSVTRCDPLMDNKRIVYIVDDDPAVRQAVSIVARALGVEVRAFARAEDFLAACDESTPSCLVLDVRMPETSGIELQRTLNAAGVRIPVIMMSGHADVRMAVEAMSQGAFTFLEKPFRMEELSKTIEKALNESHSAIETVRRNAEIKSRLESLTHKEREVLELILKGNTNREMAQELNLSLRAIEDRRSRVMKRMEMSSVVDLVNVVRTVHDSYTT